MTERRDRATSGAEAPIEANEQSAARLAGEIEGVLGVGIALESVSVAGETPARIRARCLVVGRIHDLEGNGATILEAARDLIRAAVGLRLSAA